MLGFSFQINVLLPLSAFLPSLVSNDHREIFLSPVTFGNTLLCRHVRHVAVVFHAKKTKHISKSSGSNKNTYYKPVVKVNTR